MACACSPNCTAPVPPYRGFGRRERYAVDHRDRVDRPALTRAKRERAGLCGRCGKESAGEKRKLGDRCAEKLRAYQAPRNLLRLKKSAL